jgi:basic membrane lipoprotein Med (substrate-binding protein (PBP1-ABC) superfamily)
MKRPALKIGLGLCAGMMLIGVAGKPAMSADKSITIGLIMEARPEVEPWSLAWHDAAEAMKKKDPSIKVLESYEAYDSARAEPVARQMLDSGANVLLMSTFVLSDVAKTLAPEYKQVPMGVTSFGVTMQPNLSGITASYLEMGYSNCWLLTKMSKDGRIGVVGAQKAPFETEQMEGCKLGAAAANPSGKIVLVNSNSFTDTQANREQVKALLDQGITEINLMSGTEDAVGGLRLCESSKAHCTTWGGDARQWAPKSTVTTTVLDWAVVMDELVKQARSGAIKAQAFDLTFANGGLKVPDFAADSAVSPALQAEFKKTIADLASGKIEMPPSKVHPGLR